MKAHIRYLNLLALPGLLSAASVEAKTTTTAFDPTKAYIFAQVEPVEFRMMGNNRITTGITLAPYDLAGNQILIRQEKGSKLFVDRVVLEKGAIMKRDKSRQYLLALAPGSWVIEGAGGFAPTLGAPATSFALGSYRFEAHAGEVIDLGVLMPMREESDNPDTKMTSGKLIGMMLAGPFGGGRVEALPMKLDIRPRGENDLPWPQSLEGKPITQPLFVYGATFSNSLGGLVNRIDGKAGRGHATGDSVYLTKPGQPKGVLADP